MCALAAWSWALLWKSMHGQQTVPGQIKEKKKEKERYPGSRIRQAACPFLHSLMLKSNTSSPNKPWARALFPWAVDLDPACHGPKHICSARVSWLLPWRPRQIRHDECRLFEVWQTHSFTVGWCLHKGQCHATLSLRGTEGGREKKESEDNKKGRK